MAENTGQLDKLIEEKVSKEIEEFAKNITAQVVEFLEKNGAGSVNYFYQASKWDCSYNGHNMVTETSYLSTVFFRTKLIEGFNRSVKDRMITRETKALLDKIALLS